MHVIAKKIRAVVFDFDGTLVDSNSLKALAFFDCGERFNIESELIEETLTNNPEFSRNQVFEVVLSKKIKSDATQADLLDHYNRQTFSAIVELPLRAGAAEFLEALDEKQIAAFISSATPEETLRKIIRARSDLGNICRVFGAPESKEGHVRSISVEYRLLPEEILYIGDSNADFECARLSGCEFIGVFEADERITSKNFTYAPNFKAIAVE